MKKVVEFLGWQWAFLVLAIIIIFSVAGNNMLTGSVILQTDETDQFAPPYDAFTNDNNVVLTHTAIDNVSFHIEVDIEQSSSQIYHHLYYYTNAGWKLVTIDSNEWLWNSAEAHFEDDYANIPLREGDDLFVGVWMCKGIDDDWKCGCKDVSDCGYWYVQGIDLEFEGDTEQCVDIDGDGYGSSGESLCLFNVTDCDDTNELINPGVVEIAYNGVDDDCDPLTKDDDLDGDGFVRAQDCDDTNASISPLGSETCDDGIDQDCDGSDLLCDQCGEGGIPSTGCVCAGVSEYEGFCCDNAYQEVPCGTPEVIFYDGFESGSGNTWEYLNPYAEVNKDMAQSGSYSLNFKYKTGSLQSNQYAKTGLVEEEYLFHRYFLYFEGDYHHPVEGVVMSRFGREHEWDVTQMIRQWQGVVTQGKLYVSSDGQEYDTGMVLENDQWYCVEEEVSRSGELTVWVDNVEVLSLSSQSYTGDMNWLQQGGQYSGSLTSTPIHVYIDNVVVSRQRVGCN